MNCHDGCKHAKIEIDYIVCHCMDSPMIVNEPQNRCEYFEVGSKNSDSKFVKDVK